MKANKKNSDIVILRCLDAMAAEQDELCNKYQQDVCLSQVVKEAFMKMVHARTAIMFIRNCHKKFAVGDKVASGENRNE